MTRERKPGANGFLSSEDPPHFLIENPLVQLVYNHRAGQMAYGFRYDAYFFLKIRAAFRGNR